MILISPWAAKLPDHNPNPKNYPWWPELVQLLPDNVIQLGVSGETQLVPDFRQNLPMAELATLVHACDFWISCDSFLQHFAWDLGKRGAVLWGPSLPEIFGHDMHVNIRKPAQFASPQQFWLWSQIEPRTDWWVSPLEVASVLRQTWPW